MSYFIANEPVLVHPNTDTHAKFPDTSEDFNLIEKRFPRHDTMPDARCQMYDTQC